MTIDHLLDNYSPIGDWISVLCCIILLLVIHYIFYLSDDIKFKILKQSIICILVGAVTNVFFFHACKNYLGIEGIIFAFRIVYHMSLMTVMFLYVRYLKTMLGIDDKLTRFMTILTRIVFVTLMIADSMSPITKFGFYKHGDLWEDPLISPYNIFYVYGMLMMLFMLVLYPKRLVKSVRNCLLTTEFMDILVIIYCGYRNCNTYTSFTYVTPIFIVLILLHSKPYDDKTGALSVECFNSYISPIVNKHIAMDYMILQLDMNEIAKIPEELGKAINSFWHKVFKQATLFNINYNIFVLAIPREKANGNTEEKIRNLIYKEFIKYYANYHMNYKIIGLFDIDFIQNDIDLNSILNYQLGTMEENTIVCADDALKSRLRTLREIRENLLDIDQKGDLNDERVLVYCQPIRNMNTGVFDSAEALMRLSLPGIECITPNVFIPMAEYYGLIHSLTRIMLNKVCRLIRELERDGFCVNRISVNFAASEIRGEKFCEEVLGIIESNGIDASKIGFELTESQTESDFQIVKDKIAILKNKGMTFYLDDIGTGYSNLDRIVKYDVDVVKFDRFFLVEAEKDKNVVHMMRHLSQAFSEMNYKLLFEGVENEKNEELCMNCGADYIQGYKYSKPVPAVELKNYFERDPE